ncbi:PP2C family protein-serine/threonine phosphatase [Nocardioides sp. PD653-B2]|uniref:PP2C family protein-serine/threonine phosphatase n=1 Tax=Nocardioides sp. PD653-B2 TaxID=1892811 RepID=UPI001F625B32
MPREETFCDRTVAGGRPMVVEDAREDDRFAGLPIVVGGVRFYAGAPLQDAGGNLVGTLCLFDDQPGSLDAEQLQTLEDLAAWAQQELAATGEMTRAVEVQASMLPSAPLTSGEWAIDGVCLPALAVGGDLFDYGIVGDVVHFGLGDVMGKGTGAALLGAGVRSAIRSTHAAVVAGVDLGVTTTQVARGLAADLARAESFVALFEAAVDLDDGYLRYVDAGMGLCLVVRADGRIERLSADNLPIGVLPDDHWTEQQTTLELGDRLLLFSDGLLDLVDDPVSWWEPIGRLVSEHDDPSTLLDAIALLTVATVPTDDVTAVAVYRRAVS